MITAPADMSQKHSFAILFISLFIMKNLAEENRPQSPHGTNLTDSMSSKAIYFRDSEPKIPCLGEIMNARKRFFREISST